MVNLHDRSRNNLFRTPLLTWSIYCIGKMDLGKVQYFKMYVKIYDLFFDKNIFSNYTKYFHLSLEDLDEGSPLFSIDILGVSFKVSDFSR